MNNFGNTSQQAYQNTREAQEAAYKRGDYGNMNAPEVRPAPVIEQQMQMLSDRLDVLLAQANHTEARLGGVLRQVDNKVPTRDGRIAGGTGVPLGDMLSGCVARVQEVIDRLNSIQERIEL